MKTLLLIIAILAPLWVFSQNNDPNATPSTQAIPAAAGPDRYTILVDNLPPALATKVSQAMREGWAPVGGVATSAGGHTFYQAMTRVNRVNRLNAPATPRQ